MAWVNENRRYLSMAMLALLVLSIVGPWGYNQINIPAQFPCGEPYIRLEGDFCGEPMSPVKGISVMTVDLIRMIAGALNGTISITWSEWGGMALFLLAVLCLLLPLISALRWSLPQKYQPWLVFDLIAWGLATVPTAGMLPFLQAHQPDKLWGLWIYTVLIACGLVLVAAAFSRRIRSRPVG